MMHPSRLYQGSLLIKVLFILSTSAFLCCSPKTSSWVPLEKLSSDGQWMKAGSVLVSPPIIGRIEDMVVATIKINELGLFTNDEIVIQMKFSLSTSPRGVNLFLINGLASGELNGNLFQLQRVTSSSERLELNDEGKLVFGGTFKFGSLRVIIPPIEVEEKKSSRNARLRFGNFDGDRIPKSFNLEEIVLGTSGPYSDETAIPPQSVQEAKILTWKVYEDDRPLRVQSCILWIRLNNPSKWMLVHVVRNRFFQEGWSGWFRSFVSHTKPFWIESYDHPPTGGEIELFLEANKWWTEHEGFKLLDAEVCTNAWEKATGQLPIKAFK